MACLDCDALGVSVVALIRDIEALHATLAPARDTLPADVDPWALAAQAREGIKEDDANV